MTRRAGHLRRRSVILAALLPFLSLVFLTGCWSSRELEDSAVLAGAAIEKEGKRYKITFQVLHPEKLKKGNTNAYVLISSDGASIHEAVRRLSKGLKRKLFISQTRVLIVDQKVAEEEGIGDLLDLANRDSQFRLNSYLFVANKPVELLGLPSLLDPMAAFGLATGTEVIHRDLAQMTPVTIILINKMHMGPTHAAYSALIKKHDEKKPATKHIDIDGTVFFKDGKMVKKTSDKRAQIGLLLFLNQVHQGSISLYLPQEKEQPIGIEVHSGGVRIKPYLAGDKLHFKVEGKVVGDINEWALKTRITPKVIKQVENALADEMKRCLSSIHTLAVKAPVTDVIQLGTEVERQLPQYWKKVRNRWDEVLPDAQIHYTIDAKIQDIGLIKNNNFKIKNESKPELDLFPFPR